LIKIRNKRIALLLVLTMLATMFVGVGTASAATNFIDVDSTWSWIADDEATPDVATITVSANDEFSELPDHGNIFIEVTLPDGVEFDDDPDIDAGTIDSSSADTVVFDTGSPDLTSVTISGIDLDVDDGITGSISATVRVYAMVEDSDTQFAFDEEEKTLLAKITSSDVTVTAKSAKSMYIGGMQKGADITVKEVGPGAFEDYVDGEEIKLVILTGGVTWEAEGDQIVNATYADADFDREDDKVAYLIVNSDDPAQISRIILTPYFKVAPNATGEVKVKVSGENIETETFVVGNVKDKSFAVEVKNAEDDWVYRGQIATFDDVKVNIDTKNTDLDENDWFSITLPDGVKFAKVEEPLEVNESDIIFEGLIKSNTTAWFSVANDVDFTGDFDITDFVVIADANAVVGDLKITFDGAIEGEYVIGSVKDAFTIATTPVALQAGVTGVAGNDIVITETEDGAMVPYGFAYEDPAGAYYGYDWFSIVLPAGITWDGVPTVKVTDGDIEIGDVEVSSYEDFRVLWIEIEEESNIASEITISDIKYNVLSQPALGDIVAMIGGGYDDDSYNIASSKPLEKLVVGTVATNPTAVYVIGAPTFTVNGAVQSVVTPSYIKDARTYLAIRDIATGLGIDPMNVLWDAASSKVTLIKGTKIVQVQIGSTLMNVNGVTVAMDVAPEISNGRTMLPAAFIAQAFGATASWDAATQTVTIK